MIRVDVAAALGTDLGESPVWDVDLRLLHLVDILSRTIHRLDPRTGTVTTLRVAGPPGAIALREDGGYLAGIGLELALVDSDGTVRPIATVTAGDRINDGKCDTSGRFVAGTLDAEERTGAAALYQLHPDGVVTELLPDVTLSNGLDWSPDGETFYHVDTSRKSVFAFDYDIGSGGLGERRTFVDMNALPGRPDGLTVDAEGGVWVAVARAGLVLRYDPAGRLDLAIEFPTPIVTSLTFGGPDLDLIFVTSSRALLPEGQQAADPLAGSVFVIDGVGVRGRPPNRFRGTHSAS